MRAERLARWIRLSAHSCVCVSFGDVREVGDGDVGRHLGQRDALSHGRGSDCEDEVRGKGAGTPGEGQRALHAHAGLHRELQ